MSEKIAARFIAKPIVFNKKRRTYVIYIPKHISKLLEQKEYEVILVER